MKSVSKMTLAGLSSFYFGSNKTSDEGFFCNKVDENFGEHFKTPVVLFSYTNIYFEVMFISINRIKLNEVRFRSSK